MRETRINKRMTIRDLSIKTGIDVSRISELERHMDEPTTQEVDQLAMVLGSGIKFAGMEEARKNKEAEEAFLAGITLVYDEIKNRGYGKGNGVVRDQMDCPVCGSTLFFRVAACNGHVWAKCKTDGCLAWMQ